MPLTLISGPINSGKTARVLEHLAACDPGKTGTIVVPDRGTAAELRKRFTEGVKSDFSALRSDSIQDWLSFIRALAHPNLPVATRAHSTLIVLGILDRIKLVYFKSSARSYATANGFAHTVLKLKENLITPADLTEIIEGLGEARPRERDLIKVYEAYDKDLSRLGMLDESDLTLLAIAGAPHALTEMETICFDEFTMPTPAQLAIVRALGKGLKETEIAVTCPTAHGEDEKPFAEWCGRARETWLSVCGKEERLATPKGKRPKVRVCTAPSPAQEARHVALMVAGDCVVATKPDDSFLEWYLSEAHSMELLPEHPTLDGARASPLAHELISPDMVEKLPAKANIKAFVDEMLKLAAVKAKARGWIKGLKERRGHGRVAARSLTAVSIVEDTLRSLASSSPMLGKTKITREQFAQIFSDELARRTASSTMLESVLPFRNLRLGTPLATKAERLIVPRMIEGSFPTRAGETLFFGDWKEETIRRIFPDSEENHAREAYAFETMVRKCAGEVVLIGPAVTDSGSETIPSPFSVRFGEPEGLGPVILDRTNRGRKRKDLESAFEVEEARISGQEAQNSPFAAYMGVLKAGEPRALVRRRFTEGEMGATALERYGNCPFSFFAQDVLKVKEELEDTPQIRGLDRGKLVHEILARYYRDRTQRKQGKQRTQSTQGTQGVEELIGKIAEGVWKELEEELEYVSPGLKDREIREIAGMAQAVVNAEAAESRHIGSPLTPSSFEWEFGKDHDNALEIEVGGDEPLLVRGRVDRVDLDSDRSRFLVIDYKTGGADQVINKIEKGEHLQLPLYIDAVGRSLYPNALAMGGLLVVIKEMEAASDEKKTAGKQKGLVREEFEGTCFRVGRAHSKVDEERMDELIALAREHAAGFAGGIRDGIFAATDEANCRNCDYGDICRHKRLSAD
jgi:RecB family exonuclease